MSRTRTLASRQSLCWCVNLAFGAMIAVSFGAPLVAQSAPDSGAIVALALHAFAHLPPRDSALRRAPWRVEAQDAKSREWRAAAAGVAAALGARVVSRQDSVQAVMTLWQYADSSGVYRLDFEVATVVRCARTWVRAWAYDTSYEVLGRQLSGAWKMTPPREVMHGDPTVCREWPGLSADGRRRGPAPSTSKRRARSSSTGS